MKKYDFSLKKYDFLPSRPPFLQDFCKNAQWRAKKLRERGSNTARPTEKGGGGLPIRSCRCRSVSSRRVVPIRSVSSRFADFLLAFRADSVAIWRAGRVVSVGVGQFRRVLSIRSVSVDFGASRRVGRWRQTPTQTTKARHKKSPIPQSKNRASAIARRRAILTFG